MNKLMITSDAWPKRLRFYTELSRLSQGGLKVIRDWIKAANHPRMVIIDTLAMVRDPKTRDQSSYEADYLAVLELRKMAAEYGIATVLAHHVRKAESDDVFDTVSGTLGLTGAPDSVLVLKRDSTGSVILHGRGRDLAEIEKAMTFDRTTCVWMITGEAAEVKRSNEAQRILNAIAEASEPIGPTDIAAETGMRATNIRFLLRKLAEDGTIEKASYGKYRKPTHTAHTAHS